MFEERIEVEKREEPAVNKDRKKKKRIVAIIIATIVLLAVEIAEICVAKYRADNRYIPFEELDKDQIVLIQETIGIFDDEKQVYIRAADAEGDVYSSLIPYEEWDGIENFFADITNGKKTVNRIYDDEIEKIYDYILQIDENSEYKSISMEFMDSTVSSTTSGFYYGIRYKMNGAIEYVVFWEETRSGMRYLLDDPAAEEIYYSVGSYL